MERSEAEAIVRRDLPTCIEEILALMPVELPADDFRHRLYEEMFQPSVAGIPDGTVLLVDGRMTMKVVARLSHALFIDRRTVGVGDACSKRASGSSGFRHRN